MKRLRTVVTLQAAGALITLLLGIIPQAQAVQDASPPYREVDVGIAVPAGPTLAGTLTLPATSDQVPAVVLISGSGPQDRDEAIPGVPGYRPFAVIADHLGRRGVAVLRYDDRGTAKSTGNHATATSADLASDAEAAWRFLRARREIAWARVGLMGHSEGGLIAAMVAARNPQVAFVVSMAGPGVPGYDLLLKQNERVLRAMGLPPEVVERGVAEARANLELIRTEQWDRLRAVILETGGRQLAALPEQERAKLPPLERLAEEQMMFLRTWMRFFVKYDPGPDWARVHVPVLALFGVLDVQVDLWQNRAGMVAALGRGGTGDVTVAVFPRANHLFQEATTGSVTEYAKLPPAFVPGFLDTISGWIRPRFRNP
ncbi:MAG TPA: alpha/beta fold hydrolase [bacterium]